MSMRVNGIIANRYAGRTINQAEQKSKNILEFKIQRTKQNNVLLINTCNLIVKL